MIGVGVHGPGLAGWEASRGVLAGREPFTGEPPPLPPPAILAPNERRRARPVVRLALAVACEAVRMAGRPPGGMNGVFASANGDGSLVHAILETLADPAGQVSPTEFHNSVHNAPAGYWSIGAAAPGAVSSLGCHDSSAAAALLRAAAEAEVGGLPVLLCLYDMPLPEPLASVRPTRFTFGAALVLVPSPEAGALARLRLDWCDVPRQAPTPPRLPALSALHLANPAAGLLPVLEALAAGTTSALALPLLDGQVMVDVEPCSDRPPFAG